MSPPDQQAESATQASRVLLVEDCDSVRNATAMLLRVKGFLVDVASDRAQALALARQQPPDLLLLDYRLPLGDTGLMVMESLRQALDAPALPALLLTGESRHELQGYAAARDCLLLFKPVEAAELVGTIQEMLGRDAA